MKKETTCSESVSTVQKGQENYIIKMGKVRFALYNEKECAYLKTAWKLLLI